MIHQKVFFSKILTYYFCFAYRGFAETARIYKYLKKIVIAVIFKSLENLWIVQSRNQEPIRSHQIRVNSLRGAEHTLNFALTVTDPTPQNLKQKPNLTYGFMQMQMQSRKNSNGIEAGSLLHNPDRVCVVVRPR